MAFPVTLLRHGRTAAYNAPQSDHRGVPTMPVLTIPARDVRPGDVFDVCATTFGVPTVTATVVERTPRRVFVATDHGEPLVFRDDETVTVRRPAP